jgi:hypothetical protein
MNAIPVDETLSYAYRRGTDLHVVVQLAETDLDEGTAVVRFRHQDRKFKMGGTVSSSGAGHRLEVVVPARRLGRVPWRMAVRSGTGTSFRRVDARVVAHPRRPAALLPGPAPRTALKPPVPAVRRSSKASSVKAAFARPVRRVVARLRTRTARA